MLRLARFRHLTWARCRLLLEAGLGLALYKVVLYVVPFRLLAPSLGRPMRERLTPVNPAQREIIRQVAWALEAADRRLPWHSRCLVRAVTAKRMLQRRGLPSTLYLGARRDAERKIATHAWLLAGELPLVGTRGAREYTVLATFADG
jgi:hypothetical protein